MAVLVMTNPSITIAATDVSALTTSVTLNYEIDSLEVTAFGDTGHKFTGGLQNVSVDVEMNQDYAATKTEATIYPLVGTTTTIVLIPVNTTVSATNPRYTISNTYLAASNPVAGAVGELAKMSLTFTGGTVVKTTT
jgi:hypothetical protein